MPYLSVYELLGVVLKYEQVQVSPAVLIQEINPK